MKVLRNIALSMLIAVVVCGVCAPWIAPFSYDRQFRENTSAAPTHRFLMGTDEIGRHRFSRLLYPPRTTVVLSPCPAAIPLILPLASSTRRPRRLRPRPLLAVAKGAP